MVSSAIAGVDAWIQQAEGVLAELREQGLSPSSAPRQDPQIVKSTIALGDIAEGLENVLRALCERPGRWILIAEDARRPRHFWQVIAYEDGSLFVEVVSNFYLEGDDLLTEEHEHWLAGHGWKVPDPPKWPNWSRVEATTSPAVGEVARQVVEAMGVAFGLADRDLVKTKLFSSSIRGDSPASPDHRRGSAESGADEDELGDGVHQVDPPLPVRHYSRPDPNWTQVEVMEWAEGFACTVLGNWPGREPDWINPGGGPDEEDPDIHPDPTADDPPFADEELGDE